MEKQFISSSIMEKQDLLPPAYRTHFACISFQLSDRLRVLRFPPEVLALIRQTIINNWPKGIQSESLVGTSQEIKLRGNPWRSYTPEAIDGRQLIQAILRTLFDNGWVLTSTSDTIKNASSKDALLFRLQMPVPAPCEWLNVGFDRGDRLVICGAPAELCEGVYRALFPSIKNREHSTKSNVLELKMNGYPWRSSQYTDMAPTELVLDLLGAFEEYGFSLYATVDQDSNEGDADTWYCCRPIGWSPGLPLYYR